jgi:hypothetical protein
VSTSRASNVEPPRLPPIPVPPSRHLRLVPAAAAVDELQALLDDRWAEVDDRPTEVMEKFWFLDEELAPGPSEAKRRLAARRASVPQIPAPRLVAPAAPAPALVTLPPQRGWLTRVLAGPTLMHYHRLAALVVAINIAVAFVLAGTFDAATFSQLALVNFAVALCIRQHYVVNFLFWIATRVPTSWPLAIRRRCAKVYHFGGIHVGGALAGTVWFGAFVIEALRAGVSGPLTVIVVVQMTLLVAICVMSMPRMRAKHHDTFEIVKRFGGWTSLALLWPQTAMLVDGPFHLAWEAWVLALVTFSVALPWLRLRKVPVELVVPSNHVALARFDYGVTPFAGSSTAISRSPLREWHSFANVPSPGVPGYRLTISRAGDWTGKLIDDKPSHVWVKGIPTAGVANIEVLFKKVVYIATGSGIGPCLPHLLANKVPAKLVWATRNARKTYGDGVVEEILAQHPDALIWDTHERGKPDMVQLAYQAVVETGAEAVICISNKQLTWQVVSGMESRGIPAYGAIWDS